MTRYLRFVKIEHTFFSLPLIYSGVFLAAEQLPSWRVLLLIFVAAAGARTVALSLNRIIDREIDRRNPRTAGRELPSGQMRLGEALAVLGAGLGFYLGAAYAIAPVCLYYSPIPLLIFVVYPYMKRFTPLAHLGVGLGLSMAPLGGWFAIAQSFHQVLPAILLALFTLFWVSGFDIIYSTLDEEFDRQEGLYSFPSVWGRKKALAISALLHILAFAMLLALFLWQMRTLASFFFLLLAGGLLYLEQRQSSNVPLAFFRINIIIGLVIFLFVAAGEKS
ncbi:MAG: 4-hydroxybenzoate octaprenyltransferase [bacterium]